MTEIRERAALVLEQLHDAADAGADAAAVCPADIEEIITELRAEPAGEPPIAASQLRYTIHTGNGRTLETLVPLARALEVVGQFAMPQELRRRELETIKLRAGELTTVEGIVIHCLEHVPEAAAAELVRGEHFTHTGVLMVRIRAGNGQDARDALRDAANAALEASPSVVTVQGTSVSRNPAPEPRS